MMDEGLNEIKMKKDFPAQHLKPIVNYKICEYSNSPDASFHECAHIHPCVVSTMIYHHHLNCLNNPSF